jgi:hypothetical protein
MPRVRFGKRLLAGIALLIAIAVVVVFVTAGDSPSTSNTGGASATAAATVQRRNLVEQDTESGTLSYSDTQTVYNRLNGTVTWLPAVGQAIKPGQALYKVNGEPVLLMDGSTPAYRGLSADDAGGADILELNRNLVRLGFDADGITIDDTWQPGTTDGVEQLQTSLGEDGTGTLPLGRIVFLPGEQLISTVDDAVGDTGSGGGSAPTAATDASTSAVMTPDFVSLSSVSVSSTPPAGTSSSPDAGTTTVSGTTPTAPYSPGNGMTVTAGKPKPSRARRHRETLEQLIALLRAEVAALKAESHAGSSPGGSKIPSSKSTTPSGSGSQSPGSTSDPNSGSDDPSGASGSSSGTAILQTTSTHLVVTVDLSASSQSEAVVGDRVSVELPAGNTVQGTVTAVSTVATSSSADDSNSNSGGGSGGGGAAGSGGSGSASTIPVTITLKGHHLGAGLDQAAVSVNFSEAKAQHVLSVPVTALLATSGNRYDLQEAAAPHRLIPVSTGLFAAGFVQISGAGIYPGLQVTDSQG